METNPAPHRLPFRLYPEDTPYWTFADYGGLLSVVERERRKVEWFETGPHTHSLAVIRK